MEGECETEISPGSPAYFAANEGLETSVAVMFSEPGAALGQSLISSPRSAAARGKAIEMARRNAEVFMNTPPLYHRDRETLAAIRKVEELYGLAAGVAGFGAAGRGAAGAGGFAAGGADEVGEAEAGEAGGVAGAALS